MELMKIKGVLHASRFEDYVASSLVDIAYIQNVLEDTITLLLEDDIDLDNPEDKKWISELIKKGFDECGELSATIIW